MDNSDFGQKLKVRIYNWTVRLTKYLLKLSNKKERVVWTIVDQLSRSGTSLGANYVEAIGSPSEKDFRKFLSYSLKSGNESKYWLALIRDSKIDSDKELSWLLKEAVELTNILGKSVATLYKKKV